MIVGPYLMTLMKWGLLPAEDAELEELVQMGRADTQRWAAANGYLPSSPAAAGDAAWAAAGDAAWAAAASGAGATAS